MNESEHPKVSPETIKKLMDQVEYAYTRMPNPDGTDSTLTLCVASIKGFSLGVGQSACVSPENYDQKLGQKYALENVKQNIESKLWMLSGWALFANIHNLYER